MKLIMKFTRTKCWFTPCYWQKVSLWDCFIVHIGVQYLKCVISCIMYNSTLYFVANLIIFDWNLMVKMWSANKSRVFNSLQSLSTSAETDGCGVSKYLSPGWNAEGLLSFCVVVTSVHWLMGLWWNVEHILITMYGDYTPTRPDLMINILAACQLKSFYV